MLAPGSPAPEQVAAAFVAHLDEPLRASVDDHEALARSLREVLRSARERFAAVEFDAVAVARHLAERSTQHEGKLKLPGHGEELAMVCACARGDRAAIDVLEQQYLAKTDPVLRRLGCSPSEMDDVKQDVREQLLVAADDRGPRILSYRGSGALVPWLRAVTGRRALAARRRRKPTDTLDDDVVDLITEPHLHVLKQRFRGEFRDAFRAAVASLEPEDRELLREVVIAGTPIGDLARRYGVHRVTMSRRMARIRHGLRDRTRAQLSAQLALDPGEIDSLIRLIESGLEASFDSLLQDP